MLGIWNWVLWIRFPALALGLNSLQITSTGVGATCSPLGPAAGRPQSGGGGAVPSPVLVFGICLPVRPRLPSPVRGPTSKPFMWWNKSESCHSGPPPGAPRCLFRLYFIFRKLLLTEKH